jgi:surfeit locus 1 family protein
MANWQWYRHEYKLLLLESFNLRLEEEVVPFLDAVKEAQQDYSAIVFRRVNISGTYDFNNEIVLRNRRYKGVPGVFVLTPLKVNGSDLHVLVNRGFVPLKNSSRDKRAIYRQDPFVETTVLIKDGERRKAFAPKDPDFKDQWIDAWLRVDIEKIQKQMPYPLLPVYFEIMDQESVEDTKKRIVHSDAGQDELLTLAGREAIINPDLSKVKFPVPMYSTIVPAGRHLGYVYQWSAMAVMVFIAGIILQLRRPRAQR